MVRRIDEGERPMPEINPEKVCFIIEMARNLLGEDVGIQPDASNPTDDGERIALTDANSPMRRELVQYVRDLDADETAALLALAWIDRGDYEADDWKRAVKAASKTTRTNPPGDTCWSCRSCRTTSKTPSPPSVARARISRGGKRSRSQRDPARGVSPLQKRSPFPRRIDLPQFASLAAAP
jgi:Protein of unknown function (DUF3775)